jgi:hypothetical protein
MRGLERYNATTGSANQKGTTSYSKQRAAKNQPPLMVSKGGDVTIQNNIQQRVIKQKYVSNQLNLNFIGMAPPTIENHPMTTQNLFTAPSKMAQ